jgi:hypothetical protein
MRSDDARAAVADALAAVAGGPPPPAGLATRAYPWSDAAEAARTAAASERSCKVTTTAGRVLAAEDWETIPDDVLRGGDPFFADCVGLGDGGGA